MTTETISVDELTDLVTQAFIASKTSDDNAARVARALVGAEIDGQKGHGLSRVASYTLQSATGKIDGFATPTLQVKRPGTAMVDAANGFAYPAVDLAVSHLTKTADDAGIAAAAIVQSNHAGAVGQHVERLADAGLIALFFANTPKAIAPWGGAHALFGTNPIAFAAPRRDGPPIVIDMALSEVARGKILTAAQKGEPIPEGWAVDADGQPTTDAKAALSGTLMPIGGAKGAALALMVELLAVAIGGAKFATEASSFFDDTGGPTGVGQFVLAISADGFAGRDVVLDRVEAMASGFDGNGDARLPGSRRPAVREAALRDGLSVDAATLDQIRRKAVIA